MQIIKTVSEIRKEIEKSRLNGKKIAFVPTMGKIHEGHLSLVLEAKKHADIVVTSIFVNKKQFNDPKDFEKYPRTLEEDCKQFNSVGVDIVFAPENEEIYPNDFEILVSLPKDSELVNCLCGSTRPGHFDGVITVVAKLFNIVEPDVALFGQKDFQQLQVIKRLTKDLNFNIKIIGCPIIREKSGLAMSSRNSLLSDNAKEKAAQIYKSLQNIKNNVGSCSNNLQELMKEESKKLLNHGFSKIDYFEIRREDNLQEVQTIEDIKKINSRLFFAGFIDGVRLIDNISL